jgi:hypothetical protein
MMCEARFHQATAVAKIVATIGSSTLEVRAVQEATPSGR